MIRQAWVHGKRHKTCNGWYLGMVALISSILDLLILYSKNVLGLSNSFHGGLARAFANLSVVQVKKVGIATLHFKLPKIFLLASLNVYTYVRTCNSLIFFRIYCQNFSSIIMVYSNLTNSLHSTVVLNH